jgi:hypothetical protein
MENASGLPPNFENPPEFNVPQEEAAMPYHPDPVVGLSAIEQVKQRHEMQLLAIDGVVGVGIQPRQVGREVIVVFLRDRAAQALIPTQLEGFAVETEITGEFRAY